ncbi:MAG: tRNA (adenosine(37)-N6)-threonylcarbamoyltransferase complex ATPase subunit type 1 TsaE [Deltaproteobacteria bacterium]|nr:tRNA (adenosine(37)-N6)-threonylcarbamoyltransferase complex ATPase subunit type 1 TsaE [Deltaproteobacteria bacterium]
MVSGRWSVVSRSPEETREIGVRIGRLCKAGDVIALDGDLGAGKTCLIQGLAEGLCVSKKSYVRSPTFTILNVHNGRVPLYHFDLYRLSDIDELEEIGFREYIYGEGVSAIEWASNVKDAIPAECLRIGIRRAGEAEREIEITATGERYERFIKIFGTQIYRIINGNKG